MFFALVIISSSPSLSLSLSLVESPRIDASSSSLSSSDESSSNESSSSSRSVVASTRPVATTLAVFPVCLTSTLVSSPKRNPEPPSENCSRPSPFRKVPMAIASPRASSPSPKPPPPPRAVIVTTTRSLAFPGVSPSPTHRATCVMTTADPRDGVNARPAPGPTRSWNNSITETSRAAPSRRVTRETRRMRACGARSVSWEGKARARVLMVERRDVRGCVNA